MTIDKLLHIKVQPFELFITFSTDAREEKVHSIGLLKKYRILLITGALNVTVNLFSFS